MKLFLLILSYSALCDHVVFAEETPHTINTVIVTSRSGVQDTGQVLFAWDSIFVLWSNSRQYYADSIPKFAKAMPISNIDRIVVINHGHFWSGLGAGAVIGLVGGAIIGGSIGSLSDSSTFATTVALAAIVGVIAIVPCALYYGIGGAIEGIDDNYFIGGSQQKFHDCLQRLFHCAMFSSTPPDEVAAFIKAQYGR